MRLTPAQIRDAVRGMAWWALPDYQRALWLTRAGSACPADAWVLYKSVSGSGITQACKLVVVPT